MGDDKVVSSILDEWTLQDLENYVKQKNKEKITPEKPNIKPNRSANKGYLGNGNNTANFIILENYGALSTKSDPPIFTKVNWYGNIRYDIRRWNKQLTIPKKGVTLTEDELQTFLGALENLYVCDDKRATFYGGKLNADIYNHICVLSSYQDRNKNTWTKEANIVDWGYGKKVDIRSWTEDYDKCSKGISLTIQEIEEFKILAKRDRTNFIDTCNGLEENETAYFEKEQAELCEFLKNDLHLEKLLKMLSFREREILEKRYGLRNGNKQNLEEIGKYFGVTKARIKQLEDKGLEHLKQQFLSYINDDEFDYNSFINDCRNIGVNESYFNKAKTNFITVLFKLAFC